MMLTVKPKVAIADVPASDLAKLEQQARAKGCDAILVYLAPADGSEVSVFFSEVES